MHAAVGERAVHGGQSGGGAHAVARAQLGLQDRRIVAFEQLIQARQEQRARATAPTAPGSE
nr:hypothetical protein [Nocardia tengchongensis]